MRDTELKDLPELKGWITISLAAEMLGVARQSAHRMVRSQRLAAWRVRSAGSDRPLLVKEADVLRLIEERNQRREGGRVVEVTP